MSQQPAGWYDDPGNPEVLRYWDGVVWTDHTAPRKSPTASQSTIGLAQQQASVPHVPHMTATPHGGWQAQAAPPPVHYPPQYQPYGQAPGAAGWLAGPTTADGVPLASWGKRLVAWLLDGVLIMFAANLLTPLLISGYDATGERLTRDLTLALENEDQAALQEALTGVIGLQLQAGLIAFLIASVYAIAFWTTTAQTLGKMAAGISVRHTDRPGPLSVGTAVRRRIVALLAIFIPFLFLVDGLWPLWDRRRQALHDKIASTQVVVGSQPRKQS
ncbi:MAG TPA: RDD family protein [Dermatophilaceae bacterium]|nr:RDD family protein [Dermatophilaceae bacterium]